MRSAPGCTELTALSRRVRGAYLAHARLVQRAIVEVRRAGDGAGVLLRHALMRISSGVSAVSGQQIIAHGLSRQAHGTWHMA